MDSTWTRTSAYYPATLRRSGAAPEMNDVTMQRNLPEGILHTTPWPPVSGVTRAMVDAGALQTNYVRAGGGAPVLLLSAANAADAADGPLFATLTRRFRVIAPWLVAAGAEARTDGVVPAAFSKWLRDFLDGLGVTRASVVAEGSFGLPALSFALTDPARVDRLVLLFRDAPDPALSGSALPDALRRSGHPLLVLRVGADGSGWTVDRQAAGEVIDFLSDELRSSPPS